MTVHLHRSGLSLLVTLAVGASLLCVAPGAAAGAASAAAPVVARVDVDGDRRVDIVRFRTPAADLAVVTVRTARGRTLTKRVRTSGSINPQWHGAAPLDGRRGADLVVLAEAGAHTLFHTVLTVRRGRLVVAEAPGRWGPDWVTDGAYSVAIGWRRYVKDGRAFVLSQAVQRQAQPERWTGRSVKFVWRKDRWNRVSSRPLRPRTDAAAYRFGGWHVKGLPRYP